MEKNLQINDEDLDSILQGFLDELSLRGKELLKYSFLYLINTAYSIIETGQCNPTGGDRININVSQELKDRFKKHIKFFHKYQYNVDIAEDLLAQGFSENQIYKDANTIQINNLWNKIALMEGKYKNIEISVISVVSIFTGIIMVFFGGFKLFELAVGNLTTQNDYKILLILTIISFTFFNSINSIFNVITKMIIEEKKEIKNNNVIFINLVFIALILIFGGLYIFI